MLFPSSPLNRRRHKLVDSRPLQAEQIRTKQSFGSAKALGSQLDRPPVWQPIRDNNVLALVRSQKLRENIWKVSSRFSSLLLLLHLFLFRHIDSDIARVFLDLANDFQLGRRVKGVPSSAQKHLQISTINILNEFPFFLVLFTLTW